MKKLLFIIAALVLFVGLAEAQNEEFFLYRMTTTNGGTTYTRTPITRLAYVARTDTTQLIYIGGHTNCYVTLGTLDSINLLPSLQTSMDGATWSTSTALDSLKATTAAMTIKSINLTTTTLGAPFIRFLFVINANAYALGTTTPYYWARLKLTQ